MVWTLALDSWAAIQRPKLQLKIPRSKGTIAWDLSLFYLPEKYSICDFVMVMGNFFSENSSANWEKLEETKLYNRRLIYYKASIDRKQADEMEPSLVVRASDCQCTSCNGPGFDLSIRLHSGIWGAADEAVLNIVRKKKI